MFAACGVSRGRAQVQTVGNATDGGYGSYVILTIRRDDGSETDIHAFHDVLRRELKKRGVQIGDRIEVTFLGRSSDDPKAAVLYRVSGGQPPTINWGDGDGDPSVGPAGSAPVPAPEPDLPWDSEGLPQPSRAPSIQERAAAAFGDQMPGEQA